LSSTAGAQKLKARKSLEVGLGELTSTTRTGHAGFEVANFRHVRCPSARCASEHPCLVTPTSRFELHKARGSQPRGPLCVNTLFSATATPLEFSDEGLVLICRFHARAVPLRPARFSLRFVITLCEVQQSSSRFTRRYKGCRCSWFRSHVEQWIEFERNWKKHWQLSV
jgi:hypothetical protein